MNRGAQIGELTRSQDQKARAISAEPIEQEIRVLTETIGGRVRRARELRGLTRRELSEISGVSQRYLAQVEAGQGNISVALLQKLGAALDHPIEWFVGTEDPWTSDVMRLTDLYRRADAPLRRAVMEMLDPAPPDAGRGHRLALIGLRGAGKSTLGRRLRDRFAVPFVELNEEIEDESGMPIAEVIALYGHEGYRTLERQALARVAAAHDTVLLAVAGGIVSSPETFSFLLERFHTIWLKATPEDHMERVRAQGDERPMVGNPAAMAELKTILTRREAMYGRAEITLNTSGRTEDQAFEALAGIVSREQFLGD